MDGEIRFVYQTREFNAQIRGNGSQPQAKEKRYLSVKTAKRIDGGEKEHARQRLLRQ